MRLSMILKLARQGIPHPYTKPITNPISGKPIPNSDCMDTLQSLLDNYFLNLYGTIKNKPKSKIRIYIYNIS